jgi:hypothetical protein
VETYYVLCHALVLRDPPGPRCSILCMRTRAVAGAADRSCDFCVEEEVRRDWKWTGVAENVTLREGHP